ncbi:MAG: 7-carboxy-7-deazaguanine synthase [Oceanospirillaceae bacterium]|jgi:7-carboxy-7-deazaguanine synthase
MLDISEIFGPTIQGEGKRVGRASIFIRFARCNLSCTGFGVEYLNQAGEKKQGCDTYYAVDPCFKQQWRKITPLQIIEEVTKLSSELAYPIDIVITGGEPLLFWKRNEFQQLLQHFTAAKHTITIETNASLDMLFTQPYQHEIVFSMSVKLANSAEPEKKRINIPTIKSILKNTNNSYLKFVVDKATAADSLTEIQQITAQLPTVDIYLMPKGDTVASLNENDQAVINLCVKYNYIYSDRTHIRVWNDERGV